MFRTKVENHWKENYYFIFQIHLAISIVKFNWTWSLHGWAVTSPPLLWRLITLLMNSLKWKDSSLRLGSHERRFFRIHKCYWIHQFYGYRIQPFTHVNTPANILDWVVTRLHSCLDRWQQNSGIKCFGFDVPTWNFGFKISGDTTNKGRFYFGFVNLCVDGKTNPALKRTRLITNSEQFLIE